MLILKSKAICRKTEFPLLQYQMLLDNMFNQMVEPESLMLNRQALAAQAVKWVYREMYLHSRKEISSVETYRIWYMTLSIDCYA